VGRRSRGQVSQLKQAIDPLPATTRRAMLAGVHAHPIIAGAYVSRSGGICPMLAAHRLGAHSDGGAFAHAWDRFTGARWPRPAGDRELELLAGLLNESLARDRVVAPAAFEASNGHGTNGKPTSNGRPGSLGGHSANGHHGSNGRATAPAPTRHARR
jgi:hypothetical protein